MYKLYDYSCMNKECENYQKIMEFLLDNTKEHVVCELCTACMEPCLSYAQGIVKHGTPKFHRNSKNK